MKTRLIYSPVYKVRLLLFLALLISLLAACGAASRATAPAKNQAGLVDGAPGVVPPMPAAEAVSPGDADSSSSLERIVTPIDKVLTSADQSQQARVIIYTGNISLVVQDTRQAMQAATELAIEQGGYVSASNIYQAGDVPRGSITIRVPAEKYIDTLAKLRAMAIRVNAENSGTQDVSEEYTDLQAREANLKVTEKALQQLLEERQRVGSTSDILEVYRELTDVRGQIEQMEGRLRYLANQAALSTITIDLIPDVLSQPVSVAGWEPQGVAKEALQALVATLQFLANVLIWLLIYILPILLICLAPLVGVIWLIQIWWKRRKTRRPTPPTAATKAE